MKRNKIKLLVMDVDGTLTDGKIYMGNDGELFKAFNIKDGCGIHDLLQLHNIKPVIITGRKSLIVEKRCKELGISDIFQGVKDKETKLLSFLEATNFTIDSVAYIGDDINDIKCMQLIKKGNGLIGCPKDAVETVTQIADFISEKNGGEGAVREFIEWLIKI